MKITKPIRSFIKNDLAINSWEAIASYYEDLTSRRINTSQEFHQFLKNVSELEAVLEEDMAWRYIRMTINTKDEELTKAYSFFVTEIQPKIAPFEDKINKLIAESPFAKDLENDDAYFILFRKIKTALQLYREENVPLISEVSNESQKFGALSAAQNVEYRGKKLTMQQASLLLKETDEVVRKEVFDLICNRRRKDVSEFDELFDSLLAKRTQIAKNAGFENFRDYKLTSMGRFDYSVQDCLDFHKSIKDVIVPIVRKIQEQRLEKLGKDKFKPWDLDVDPEGKKPLKPFKSGDDLLHGTVSMFKEIDPFFGDCLATMYDMKHLDLDSKDGKAPGGYNYPLYETGVPFIFMNAVGSHRDLVTMVHEGGHAIHSFLSRDLELTEFKSLPSEVAELASMSMELLSMEKWNEFYKNDADFIRAKREQLETIIKILPWIAQVDEFQHWIYENPNHSRAERTQKWEFLNKEYGTGLTDWTGYEDIRSTSWQRQLHIFEVPFYYIEYGIAQLGALGIWKNSLIDKEIAVQKYKEALKLAYTKSIPEIYAKAGVKFDFKANYLKELASFVEDQLDTM